MGRIKLHFIILPLLVIFCSVSTLVPVAGAAVIDTPTVLNMQKNGIITDRPQTLLIRGEVYDRLVELGVDPDYALQRVAALSDQEIGMLHQNIDNLPAGGDILAVLGAIFLGLIVFELLGVTNVFRTR